MQIHQSTIKRQRQTKVRKIRNQAILSKVKSHLKKAKTALDSQDTQAAQNAVVSAISVLDRAASKGVIHKRKASRAISRLSRRHQKFLAAHSSKGETGQGAADSSA